MNEKCELIWGSERCTNKVTRRIKVVIHSNIFSGINEVGNKEKQFDCCDEHWEIIKSDPNVKEV